MPVNDKLPIIEPVQDSRKNGVATLCLIVAILVWCLGGVLTAFAGLAYAEIGSFSDIFIELFPEGMMLTDIVILGIGVFIGGMLLLAVSEALRLLQRNATTTYTIRYLDLVIPQTVSVSVPEENTQRDRFYDRNDSWDSEQNADTSNVFRASQGDRTPISITVNVNAATGEVESAAGTDGKKSKGHVQAAAAASASPQKKGSSEGQASHSTLGNLLTKEN